GRVTLNDIPERRGDIVHRGLAHRRAVRLGEASELERLHDPGGTLLETEGGARLKERAQCLDRLAGPLGDRTDPAFERRGSRVHADLPAPSLYQAAEPAEQGAPRLGGVRHLVP